MKDTKHPDRIHNSIAEDGGMSKLGIASLHAPSYTISSSDGSADDIQNNNNSAQLMPKNKVENDSEVPSATSSGENFKKDLSSVSVYNNSQKALDLGARAFAQGSDIHFAPGELNTESEEGLSVLGHEVHHTVQQKSNKVQANTSVNGTPVNDDKGLEKEADQYGSQFAKYFSNQGASDLKVNAKSAANNPSVGSAQRMPHGHTAQLKCNCPACSGGAIQRKKSGNESVSVANSDEAPVQGIFGSIGRAISKGASAVGGAISDGASAVGGAISDGVSAVGGTISDGVSAVGGLIQDGAEAVGGLVSNVIDRGRQFIGGAIDSVIGGLQRLGSGVMSFLQTAGEHVWRGIQRVGSMAVDIIREVGVFLWDKICLIGENAFSFITNLPKRFWRILALGWEGIKGGLQWVWGGISGLGSHITRGLRGLWNHIGEGISGAMSWLQEGLQSGAAWAVNFIQNPSLDALFEGLSGLVSWGADGLRGFAQWGFEGLSALAVWIKDGAIGFANWLWDGFTSGLEWLGRMALHILEAFGLGELLMVIWGILFRMRKLTSDEIAASQLVHPPGMIPYDLIRVDDNSLISMIGGAAVTTMHVIHVPEGGISIDVMVHELTHVAQYEAVGAVYMAEAIHAQTKYGRTGGVGSGSAYDYEREGPLEDQRSAGATFSSLNRESQAELVQDYYVALTSSPPLDTTHLDPYIQDMQNGNF